ncbi:MAG: glycosyltransferase family 4 protein [Candidatus Harrisonbacteria bacterium]|nr:glycosyltransferase family 4 protein [Candidatus Harrisonbacteria bacterium]
MAQKILIVSGIYPPEIGGAATYAELMLRELSKKDFTVEVLTNGAGNIQNVHFISAKGKLGRYLKFFWAAFTLAKRFDVVYAVDSSFGAATIAAFAAFFARKKFMMRVTGDYAWEQGVQRFGVKELLDDFSPNTLPRRYRWQVRALARAERFAARRARVIIAPSEYLKRVVETWGIAPEKIKVIFNGVDAIKIAEKKSDIRERLGWKGITIVSAGRLVPWKGFLTLIDAFFDVVHIVPGAKLFIVGDGPEREMLEKKVETMHLQGSIVLMGRLSRERLARYLKAADVFVLNTGYEGFSHQLVEAMSAGLPVVTTAVGGNVEVIEDKVNGILVDYNDREMLAEAMKFLLRNPAAREKLGVAAAETASEFTTAKMMEQLARLLANPNI